MKLIARISLVLIIISFAMPVLAADPELQSPQAITAPVTSSSGVNEAKDTVDPQNLAKNQDQLGITSPMVSEIELALTASKLEIAELVTQVANSSDFAAKQLMQEEISAIKQQTELDILGIQARYARTAGNEDLANQIDNAIETIISPPAPSAPAEERPAPVTR